MSVARPNVGGEDRTPGALRRVQGGRAAPKREGAKRELVPLTKSASGKDREKSRLARRRRYKLQENAMQLLPGHRVTSCGWRPTKGGQLGISCRDGQHFVSGAAVCGSVWVCPVCAAKIALKRATELEEAVARWIAQGGTVWMLTLTINHTREDSLTSLLSRFTASMRGLWSGGWSERWRKAHGQVGTVRNIEVTWGASNGWHPHCHAILFVSADADPCAAELDIKQRWQKVAARYGFGVSLRRGATLEEAQDPKAAADYATKPDEGGTWGMAQELTWANIKTARTERFTPFALLAACDSADVGAAPALFQDYADTFKGRRQLYWSKGLRDLLGLNSERSDEDVAHDRDEQSTFVCAISTDIFCWIKARGFLCDLLEAADEDGFPAIESFIEWAYDCRAFEARERRL
jgi:hypothetical protein